MRRISQAVALAALLGVCSGCYHHHLRANGERVNTSYFRQTLDYSGWAKRNDLVVPPAASGAPGSSGLPSAADCKDNGIYEVGVRSNFKYAAGTVFSFGRWSRLNVEWLCAKQPPVIGPSGLGPQPPGLPATVRSPRPPIKPRDGFSRRTVHAFFWGAVQQNLLPPSPSPTANTPANCSSMRQVKFPPNYGYSLITVITAGIWSPMKVAWRCNEHANNGSKAVPPGLRGTSLSAFPLFGPLTPIEPRAGSQILSSKEENYVPR